MFDDDDFKSGSMCCACDGGINNDDGGFGDCMNAPDDFVDSGQDTCSSYTPSNSDWCNKYDVLDPSEFDFTELVFISQKHCCECGGGSYDGGLTYSESFTTSYTSASTQTSPTYTISTTEEPTTEQTPEGEP